MKSVRQGIARRGNRKRELPTCYLAFFEQFNAGRFFEAHEVLERLWLPERGRPLDGFYKGLIQVAGAFVHLEKGRVQPALALFALAEANLGPFSPTCERLAVSDLLKRINEWRARLRENLCSPFTGSELPRLELLPARTVAPLRK